MIFARHPPGRGVSLTTLQRWAYLSNLPLILGLIVSLSLRETSRCRKGNEHLTAKAYAASFCSRMSRFLQAQDDWSKCREIARTGGKTEDLVPGSARVRGQQRKPVTTASGVGV